MGPPVTQGAVVGRLAVVKPPEGELGTRGFDREVQFPLEFIPRAEIDWVPGLLVAEGYPDIPTVIYERIPRIRTVVPVLPGFPVGGEVYTITFPLFDIPNQGMGRFSGIVIPNVEGNPVYSLGVCWVGLKGEAQGVRVRPPRNFGNVYGILPFSACMQIEQVLHVLHHSLLGPIAGSGR